MILGTSRIDYSLHRLYHYTGTDPEHFQNFVIFTNYQFYAETFARLCRERMAKGESRYRLLSSPATSSRAMRASAAPVRLATRRSASLRCRPFISSSQAAAASP